MKAVRSNLLKLARVPLDIGGQFPSWSLQSDSNYSSQPKKFRARKQQQQRWAGRAEQNWLAAAAPVIVNTDTREYWTLVNTGH